MNETVAKIGGQIRQAFVKVRDAWKEMAPARKKLILIIAGAVLVLAVVLGVVLNAVSGRYQVLYNGMSRDDSVRGLAALQAASIPGRLNSTTGELEVPSKLADQAMVQLAMNNIPSTTLDHNIIAEASGLTTTEFEKREYSKLQWQDRLQNGIKAMAGVQNAYVHLNLASESNRVWDSSQTKASASVQLFMASGNIPSTEMVNGIRYLIGNAMGMNPDDVAVIDQSGNLMAAEGESYDVRDVMKTNFLSLLDLEAEVQRRMENNAREILSLEFPDPDDYRVSAKVTVNTESMVQEIMEYVPLEGTNTGVIDEREDRAVIGPDDFVAEGVVGETDNTDVPIYVDENGDGIVDYIDWSRYIDYLVSYTMTQIEKQDPSVEDMSLAVVVAKVLSDEDKLDRRELMANATGVPVEKVTVTGVTRQGESIDPPVQLPTTYIMISGGVALILVIILVLVLILRSRSRKKQLLAEAEAAEAEAAETERIQAEIEERKKQLKDAALGDEGENAILDEVREFAKNNPEIAANLLRNWLKDGVE